MLSPLTTQKTPAHMWNIGYINFETANTLMVGGLSQAVQIHSWYIAVIQPKNQVQDAFQTFLQSIAP